MLEAKIGDKGIAFQVFLGLWAQCQTARTDVFELDPWKLASICGISPRRGRSGAKWLEEIFAAVTAQENRILDPETDGKWRVHGWSERNSKMSAAQVNGKKGGRPSKTEDEKKSSLDKPNPDLGLSQPQNPESGKGREGKEGYGMVGDGAHTAQIPAPPVEFPDRFPATEEQAVAWGQAGGMELIPAEWIISIWKQVISQDFKNAAGASITNWGPYIAQRWPKEKERQLREAAMDDLKKNKSGGGGADSLPARRVPLHDPEPKWDWKGLHRVLYDADAGSWDATSMDARREMHGLIQLEPNREWRGALARAAKKTGAVGDVETAVWSQLAETLRAETLILLYS